MKDNNYKKLLSKIDVPPELINNTRIKMAQEEQKLKNPIYRYQKPLLSISAVAAVLVILLLVRPTGTKSDYIVSDLPKSGYLEQVELKDGYLNFSTSDPSKDPSLNLGNIHILTQPISKEDYTASLGVDVAPTYLPTGYELGEESYLQNYRNNGQIDSVESLLVYQNEDHDTITLLTSDDTIYLPEQVTAPNISTISDTEIRTGYQEDLNQFSAVFEKDAVYYVIYSNGLSQKDFIEVLHSFWTVQ